MKNITMLTTLTVLGILCGTSIAQAATTFPDGIIVDQAINRTVSYDYPLLSYKGEGIIVDQAVNRTVNPRYPIVRHKGEDVIGQAIDRTISSDYPPGPSVRGDGIIIHDDIASD